MDILSQFPDMSLYPQARQFSHFPVYQKDHLFNSNPGWDFGAFRRLHILVKQTNFNSTRCSWASKAQKVPNLDFCLLISASFSFPQVCPCVLRKREVCVRGQCCVRVEYGRGRQRGRHRLRSPVLVLPANDPGTARQAWDCQAAPTQLPTRLGSDSRCVSPLSKGHFCLTTTWNLRLWKMFCRCPESAAACSHSGDHHAVGFATLQSQTCLPVEDKAKVAQSWRAFLSSGLFVQQRWVYQNQGCPLCHLCWWFLCEYVNNTKVTGSNEGYSEQ